MFTFLRDLGHALTGASPATPFMAFFVYVWVVWVGKALAARRYRPCSDPPPPQLRTTVLVPVFNEPEPLFRRVLASVRANGPSELIAVVDGGDAEVAAVAADYCDRVLRIPKLGKRGAIAAGLRASDPTTDVVLVLDSDTVWAPDAMAEMLRPFGGGGGAAPGRRPARGRPPPAAGAPRRR